MILTLILSSLFSIFGESSLQNIVSVKGLNLITSDSTMGTGVLIDKTHVLTAAHVVNPADGTFKYKVECLDHEKDKLVDITEIKIDTKRDLALLTISEQCENQLITKLAKRDGYYGDTIYTIGCPGSFCGVVSRGVISAYRKKDNILRLVSDIKIWHGSSGGPLYNEKKELVGICSQISTFTDIDIGPDNKIQVYSQNYGIFIPISEIKQFLKEIKD